MGLSKSLDASEGIFVKFSDDSQDAEPLPSTVAPTPLPSKASPTPMTFPLKKDRPAIVKSTPISAPLAAKKKV